MPEQPTNQDTRSSAGVSLPVVEEGLDPASQSLSDALRVSFKILKVVMAFIVIAFLCSGFFTVEQNEAALVLRFGRLRTDGGAVEVYEPGFKIALPEPIDEKVKIRTDQRQLTIDTFALDPKAVGHTGGLIPGLDGCMITADRDLIHASWTLLYRVDEPATFVTGIADAERNDDHGGGVALIRAVVENAVLHTAARYTFDEILLERTATFLGDVQNEVTDKLKPFGIYVVDVLPKGRMTPPTAVIDAWSARTAAAQTRAEVIQKADSERASMLSDSAGAVYPKLLEKLNEYEQAKADGNDQHAAALEQEIQTLMLTDATGRTARRLSAARAFQTGVYEAMRRDVKEFNDLLPEFEKNPETVVTQLWTKVKTELLSGAEGKFFTTPGSSLDIIVQPDPNWKREDEIKKYAHEAMSAP